MKNIVNKNYYKKKLTTVDAELLTLPTGNLIIRGKRCSHLVNGKEASITKNKKLIQLLCRKKYLLALKKRLNKNISAKSFSQLVDITPEDIIRSLPASFQKMPISYFYHHSIEKWQARPSKENTFKGKKYEIKDDVVVRSKSEFMIGIRLEEYENMYNFLYLYEPAITLGGQTIYPDFIAIDLFTGMVTIWEHFGALHEPGYEKEMNKKMELYLKHGFIPFETLIYTFEFDMNTRRIRDLIENIILAD